MQEIKYLTEKDMEYFYKLEEQGEAVIIRLEPEQLLSLDLSELDRRKTDADSEISEEEIRQWLQQHSLELRKRYEENEIVLQENRQMRIALDGGAESHGTDEAVRKTDLHSANAGKNNREAIIKLLQQKKLDDEQANIINEAILAGLDEKQLLAMLMDGMTAEKMRKMYEIFLSMRAGE